MFKTKTQLTVPSWVIGVACLVAPSLCHAIEPIKLTGAIAGTVRDHLGVPQMGAAVFLYNHQNRMLEKVLTDEHGEFKLLGLLPDLYFIKVTFAAFAPTLKQDIKVQPGMRSLLNIRLDTLFSSLQLMRSTTDSGALMTDDWKWVLRSSSATRPVLRFVGDPLQPAGGNRHAAVFSETRGLLKVSAGEGALAGSAANQADLGTAFALATSVYGNSQLQVSGNLGYGSATGVPAAAFRTSYSRNMAGGSPEISLTMRQLYVPGRLAAAFTGNDSAMPALRTMSAELHDHTRVAEDVTLQYGFAMDCVSFVDHLNYFSPYARLSYEMNPNSTLEFAYTSGNARPDLAGTGSDEAGLQQDLSTLGMFPRISTRRGLTKVQRGEEYEMAYSRKMGHRTLHASAYRESVQNLALSLVAPGGFISNSDLLPDLFSNNSIFNLGNFGSTGLTVAMSQEVGNHVTATVMYSATGALTADDKELVSNSPDDLRAMIHEGRQHSVTTRVTATAPKSGTHLIASYQWAGEHRWAVPGNLYSTQSFRPMPGLNLYVRQPIPGFRGRVEATADLRNMLAQGYLPLNTANGQRVLLVQNPRSLRGGLSFIF